MASMKDKNTIIVKKNGRTRFINASDVVYIESIGRKAVLHLPDETIEYYERISRLEQQLSPLFFRIHRAYLINLNYIESYNKREVKMNNQELLLISKYRFHEFQKAADRNSEAEG